MRPETFQMLAVLAEGEHDSSEILQAIRCRTGGTAPSLPTLYRRLKEALDAGWVEATDPDATVSAGPGRPRQTFRLTVAGLAVARDEAATWARFAGDLLGEEGAG